MINIRRLAYIGIAVLLCAGLFTGCESPRIADQEECRQEGIELLSNGEYEKALELFEEALELSLGTIGERELDICFYKAEVLLRLNRAEEAIATYTAIIDYNQSPEAYYLRGNAYFALVGNTELDCLKEAMEDYDAAIAKDPNNYELYLGIYQSLQANGAPATGAKYLTKGLQIEGNTAVDKLYKGRIWYLYQDYEEAEPLLKQAAEAGESEAYYYLVEMYLTEGKQAEAAEALEAYLKAEIADSYRLYEIANLQMENGNYKMAISCLEKAMTLDKLPNRRPVMQKLVKAYEEVGDFTAARAVLGNYVKLYPEDEEAKKELTFLETR